MPGKTIIILRINPKEQDMLGQAMKELKTVKAGELKDAKEEEIGFGIKVIKAGFLVNEKDEQGVENLLKEVNALKSIDNAEMTGMTLL